MDWYYSYGGVLAVVLGVVCAVHVLKTGRPIWWVFIFIFAPVIGSLIYFFVEILPELRSGGAKMASGIARTIDPKHGMKRRANELALTNTLENKQRYAEECLRAEHYQEAAEIYQSCLTGIHKEDPKTMLGLATARFHLKLYQETKETLDRLIAANPQFKSPEGHLLYARTLEELGENDEAFEEYRVLAGYYPGIEAKCRYALLLKQVGRNDEARELLNEIVLSAKQFRHFYKGDDKRWISLARENLAQLGG